MKKAALIAQKGGVGKTTLAVNLAVASGLRSAIFDLDPQESATIWADRRKNDLPHVEFLTERRLADGLKAAERGGFDLAIIDTPPAAGPQAFSAAQSADLILIPCRPSLVDLDAIRRTAQLIKSLSIPAFVVFNAAPHSATTLLDDARAIAEEAGLSSAPTVLRWKISPVQDHSISSVEDHLNRRELPASARIAGRRSVHNQGNS